MVITKENCLRIFIARMRAIFAMTGNPSQCHEEVSILCQTTAINMQCRVRRAPQTFAKISSLQVNKRQVSHKLVFGTFPMALTRSHINRGVPPCSVGSKRMDLTPGGIAVFWMCLVVARYSFLEKLRSSR